MSHSCPAITLALILALPCAGGARAQSADTPAGLLGMDPLVPAIEAPDFSLTDTGGTSRSLSGYRGQWVLLTFWATWCGPCRSEMPSLQLLAEEHGDRGLAILGVVVGSDPGNARDFVHRHGLTFPSLVDAGDRVAATYRASSIPLTYLVDPAGQLVGISRGARDWSAASASVGLLLSSESSGAGRPLDVAPPATSEELVLPADLIPPTGVAELAVATVRVGRPAELRVHVHWAGDADQYVLLTPHLDVPAGLVQGTVGASSSSLDGTQRVTYTFHLETGEAGSYPLDPIEIRFTPRGRSASLYTRLTGPTLVVTAAPARWPWIAGGVVAAGIGLAVASARRRRG